MSKIKKVLITELGDESKLAIVEADLPGPVAIEVQIQVRYSIVAGSDVNMRRGTYPFQKKAPFTPGYSVLGSVRKNGKGCSRFRAGDCVVCLSKYSGQAELINLPEKYLVPVPDGVDLKSAVAPALDWVTAYQMLQRFAHIQAGQKIFVHGLSGSVGGALLALAKIQGSQVFGTASSSKHKVLQGLGAIPFDYSNKDWIGAVQQFGGVDAVFDPLGFKSLDESYSILKRGGILVAYGMNLPGLSNASRPPVLPVLLKLLAKNLFFWTGKRTTFFGVSRASKNYKPDLELLLGWLKSGKIAVSIKATFRLDEVQAAHREYARSTGIGSIILEING
jgi:NADPH:quinone reductase-like Zn-dependent oxidoreductase